jgi:hypothetical protein
MLALRCLQLLISPDSLVHHQERSQLNGHVILQLHSVVTTAAAAASWDAHPQPSFNLIFTHPAT